MMMQKLEGLSDMTISEILAESEHICRANDVKHLYLFGSFAAGTATGTSDVDLAVKGVPDIGELQEKLEQIPTLRKIDVVDYDDCRNELLKEDIDRYGQKIY